jgi:eukaryotic-like serine/threonine-protein kinase
VHDTVTYIAGHCPSCGRSLPADAAEGLCAACLLAAGTQTLTASSIDETPTMSSAAGGAATRAAEPRLGEGQPWGAYRIGRLLGRGGMGEVYEAEHRDSGRRVALKVLRSRLQTADERARFLREGQLAASVSHPHTVYIFGSEEIAGMPVISMELLPGGTLKDLVVERGPLPPAEAVSAVLDIIGGLDAAQAAGILHRDIKPSNCFVDRDGTVKVGDFGLSVSTLARDVHHELETSGFEGTPQFAPPEQLRGEPLDVRADIYAVGATLYYLLTGQPPFDAPDLRELFARVTNEVPRSPRELRPQIPPRLAAVVMQCLAKAPADRPASYAALADVLRPFLPQADAPARPAVRLAAGVVDVAILALPLTVWSLWAVDVVTQTAERNVAIGLWSSVVTLIYYLVLEGVWGASLGKRLFGLRVATTQGAVPSFMRVAGRTVLYFAIPNALPAVLFFTGAVSAVTITNLRTIVGLLITALLFSTMRTRNGWAAVHDLVSGTRVVQRAEQHATRLAAEPERALDTLGSAAGARGQYGPFTVSGDAGMAIGETRLLVGFDPILRRQVWIHVVPLGTPAVGDARRDISRIGRLHWLTGRRSADENWDAYEAPGGRPLSLAPSTLTWAHVKLWLLDLGQELTAAAREGALPPLQLNRLWLRHDGHLVLLDFPAPGADADGDPGPDAGLTPVALLAALGTVAGAALSERYGPASMPLSARTAVARWSSQAPPDLDGARADLTAIARSQSGVRRSRRAIPIALAATPAAVVVVAAALLLPYLYRFMTNRETVEILSALSALQNPNPRDARLRDPEIREAIERYLAGRYGSVLEDDRFWSTLIMQRLSGNLRPVARDLLARHDNVSRDEVTRAAEAIAPERTRWAQESNVQIRGLLQIAGIIVTALTALVIALVLGLSLVSAVLVPGGMLLRVLGYAVITGDGREVGRGRSLARVVVAWAPALVWLAYLLASPKIQGFAPTPSAPWLALSLTFGLLTIGAVWTLMRRTRGPHDWLVGTWVAPR